MIEGERVALDTVVFGTVSTFRLERRREVGVGEDEVGPAVLGSGVAGFDERGRDRCCEGVREVERGERSDFVCRDG